MRETKFTRFGVLLLGAACWTACGGDASSSAGPQADTDAMPTDGNDPDDDTDGGPDTDDDLPAAPSFDEPRAMGPVSLRRLTHAELRDTLALALDEDEAVLLELIDRLPADSATPFDNDVSTQTPSAPLVEGLLSIAETLSTRLADDPGRMHAVWGCVPDGPSDAACLRSGATKLGRRLLRRPLSADEADAYASFIAEAQADDDFSVALALVLQSLLLDAEFLYRVEIGEPIDTDLVRLSDDEIATRLAFLLWGQGPDDALLDRVAAGDLSDAAGLEETVDWMVADSRTLRQVQRLHAMWLGYETMPIGGALGDSLRTETDKLIERGLVERSWLSMFESEATWLDATLAEHYDIELPGGQPGWVDYPDLRRGGLMSHGTVLSLGKKFGDTSPTERGKAVWTRLLCQEIPPPPPEVDSGIPPSGGPANACKEQRYDMREKVECASCHAILDSIGFGLENYGPAGEWRVEEPDRSDCRIAGEGELAGSEPFAGAGALGTLLVETGQLEGCFMQNVYQFAVGRAVQDDDTPMITAMTETFEDRDDFVRLIRAFATSEGFRHRVLPSEN